ncbi:MAG: hypothetical protein ACYC5O_08170, partial [Anaerolineae bacterium]
MTKRLAWLAVAIGVALGVVLSATPVAADGGFISERLADTIEDFTAGTFLRTALVNIPADDISAVQLLPVGLSGEWVLDPQTMQTARQDCAAVASGQYVYVLGGRSGNSFFSTVERFIIGSDGSVSTRAWVRSMPTSLAGLSAFVYTTGSDTRLYIVGGATTGFTPSPAVYSASVAGDGSLGTWRTEASLEYGVYYAALAEREADVYLTGGMEVLGGTRRTVEEIARARIDGSGAITEWIYDSWFSAPVYPLGVAAADAIVHQSATGDILFVIGGRDSVADSGALTTVAYTDINADGSLQPWQLSGGTLLLPLYGHGLALVAGDEILLTGGRTDASHSGLETSVKAALVEPDRVGYRLHDWCERQAPDVCRIGSWQAGAALPVARAYHGTVRVGDWVYVLGGSNTDNQSTSTIYRGTISGDALLYAPDGVYDSPSIDMGGVDVVRLGWEASVPSGTTMTLQYATCTNADVCTWAAETISVTGNGSHVPSPALTAVARFRYRLTLTGSDGTATVSPRLETLHVYYDANPPDVGLTLGSSSTPIRPGGSVAPNDTVRYSVDAYNSGGVTAQGVVVTVTLAPQLTFLSGQCPDSQTWQSLGGGVYRCPATAIAAAAHAAFTINTQVGSIPEDVTVLITTAAAAFPPMQDLDAPPKSVGDANPANNTATRSLNAIPLALLGTVSASPAPGSVSPGQQIEYRLAYRVGGGAGATVTNVVLNASIDSSRLVNVEPLDGGTLQGNSVRWYRTGPLATGYTETVRFRATVRRPLANGVTVVQSFTGWSYELPSATIGSVTHDVVSVPAPTVQLAADSGATIRPGQTVTYTLTCVNSGGIASIDGLATAVLDPALTLLSTDPPAQVDGGQLTWSLGTMEIDTPVALKIVARVADNAVHGQMVTLGASLASTGVPPGSATLQQTVSVPAAIQVTKVAEVAGGYIRPGDALTYRLTFTNVGGETSGQIAASDWVPSYCLGPSGQAGGSLLSWQIGPLAGQESVALSYTVIVSDPLAEQVQAIAGPAANAVAAGATTVSAATSTPVRHWPNLWVAVSDGRYVTDPGRTHDYTVTYGNHGGDGLGGTITLNLGQGLNWVSGDGWQAQADGTYRLAVGSLAQGAQGTAGFRAMVSESLSPNDPNVSLSAECSFTGTEKDSDPYDNEATDVDIISGPDLAVLGVTVAPSAPNRWDSLSLVVGVGNLGNEGLAARATKAGTTEVMLEVYLRRSASSAPSGPGDHLGGYCFDGGCSMLRPVFKRAIPVASLGPGVTRNESFPYLTFAGVAGLYDVYAQIDVDGDSTWGGFR